MGKRIVVPKLPNPVANNGGSQSPLIAALEPIVTAAEYCGGVIALVQGLEDVSDDNQKMLDLSSASRRLLLARYDPPLPLYWTFVALEKSLWLDRESKDALGFGTAILDFARRVHLSLISFSGMNASGRTALAAIAPVVGLVYDVASLLSTATGPLDKNQSSSGRAGGNENLSSSGTAGSNGKQIRKLAKNLKEFIKELLGFRVLCLLQDSKTFERSLSLPSAPNVPLENFPDFIYPAFPLASKGMAKLLSRDLVNSAVVAEIVSGEVVLLQLVVETIDRRIVLKKRDNNFSVGEGEFFQKLKDLAVHSVCPTNSSSPSEMILDAVLEKRLPVLDLLDAKEEILVKGVLLETVLADPPLFSSHADAGEAITSVKAGLDHSSVVFMKKLSVARQAAAIFRSREELSRLAALETRVNAWHVPPQLLKWLKSKTKDLLPVIAMQDQQALTKWLVKRAEKSVFAALLGKCVASWSSGLISVGTTKHIEVLEVESGEAQPGRDGEDLFFVDTAGETKAAIDTEAAADLNFASASKTMKGDSAKRKNKKKSSKSSKVLFHRHVHSSTGTKRSRMEIDDVDASSSSGSDSEDSEETRSKPAKKLKKSKQKAIDVYATSEEDEDDDKDGALALEYHGSVGIQQQAELQTPKDHGVTENQPFGGFMTGGPAEEEVPKIQEQVVARALLDDTEVGAQGTPSVSCQGALSLGTSSRSRKGKTAQRFEVTGGVGTREPPSQAEVALNVSVAVTEVDIQNTSTNSLDEPVLASAGKIGKKNKKMRKDPEDSGLEAGGAGAEEFSSQLLEETVNISVSATAADIQNSLTISPGKPVLPSSAKSAKKKKKSKSPEGPYVGAVSAATEEVPSQLCKETDNTSGSVTNLDIQNTSTSSLDEPVLASAGKTGKKNKKTPKDPEDPAIEAGGAGAEEFSSQLLEETVNISVSATAAEIQNSLTISPGKPVLPSPAKSAKKKKKSKDPEGSNVGAVNAATEEVPSQVCMETDNTSVSVTKLDIQNTFTSSLAEPLLASAGKTGKKNKKMPKDPEDPDIEAGGAGAEEFSSQLLEETVNISVSATAADIQNSLTIFPGKPVLPSPAKSAKKKKKSKDPEGPYVGAVSAATEEVPSQLCKETDNTSGSVTKLDIQNTSTSSLDEPVLASAGKTGKKNKKMPKDPEDPEIEAGSAGAEEFSSQLLEETVNTSVSATAVDIQNSLTFSPGKPVLPSPAKSANKKKKSKDPEGPYVGAVSAATEEVPSQPYKETDNTSVSVTKLDIQNTSKLVSGYPESDTEGKGAAHESPVVITTSEAVETRVEIQGVYAKDLPNEVTTTTGEEVETWKSSEQTSLTPQNENGEDVGEIGDMAARVQCKALTNVEEETLVVKSSKKKKRKEISRHGEVDQIQIFDAIKQEHFTTPAKLSSADLLDILQVEKSLQNDQPEGSRNTRSRNKRVRSGDDGDSFGDVQGTTTREPAVTVSFVNSDTMKSGNESTQDGKSSEGYGMLAEILGKGQVEYVGHDESEPNISRPGFTQVNEPIDSVVLGAQDGSRDTDRLAVQPTNSPTRNVIAQTELRTKGTPASGASFGSKLKKNRDATSTPTSRKKRSKDQIATASSPVAENRIPPKEALVVFSDATDISQDEKDQVERAVRTPHSSNVSETESVTLVTPSSRKHKVNTEIPRSVESGTTEGNPYQRRTRSGRALGFPPPTPGRKINTRKKLVLEPLEQEN